VRFSGPPYLPASGRQGPTFPPFGYASGGTARVGSFSVLGPIILSGPELLGGGVTGGTSGIAVL
jgi:hypothetical protein